MSSKVGAGEHSTHPRRKIVDLALAVWEKAVYYIVGWSVLET